MAIAFLRERGCQAVATEVRCPIARYRVDVAGFADARLDRHGRRPSPAGLSPPPPPPSRPAAHPAAAHPDAARRTRPGRGPARTVLIECKQDRADFLRDRRDQERLLREREALERICRSFEENRIRVEEPELRREGTSLFPDLDEWDYAASRLPAYRELLKRLRRIDRRLHGETKFCMTARYALADRLYIAAPRGMIRRRELPPGWGLLECSASAMKDDDPRADLFGDPLLRVTVRAPEQPSKDLFRQRLLRNIAVAASRTVTG